MSARFELRPVHVHDNELAHVCHQIMFRRFESELWSRSGWRCDRCMEVLDAPIEPAPVGAARDPGAAPVRADSGGLSASSDAAANSHADGTTHADPDCHTHYTTPPVTYSHADSDPEPRAQRAELPADAVRGDGDVPERRSFREALKLAIDLGASFHEAVDYAAGFAAGVERGRRTAADDKRRK